jgi:hypothetical protein
MYIEELHSLERVTHSVVNNDETNKPVTGRRCSLNDAAATEMDSLEGRYKFVKPNLR